MARAKSPASSVSSSAANLGFEAAFGPLAGAGPNTFRRDLDPDLRADYDLVTP